MSVQKGIYVPLLLECGHPVCNKCAKIEKIGNCSECNKSIEDDSNRESLLPLNLYTLGLIVSSYNRPLDTDDEDFLFCHRLSTHLRQISKQG